MLSIPSCFLIYLTVDFHIFDNLSSLTESASQTPNQVDLFGESLIGDLMDAPTSVPTEALVMNANSEEVDLFADAAFVSAPPQAGKEGSSQTQVRYLAILNSGNEMLCFSFWLVCHIKLEKAVIHLTLCRPRRILI